MAEYGTPSFGGFAATFQTLREGKVGNSNAGFKNGVDLAYIDGSVDVHLIYDTAAVIPVNNDYVFLALKETIIGAVYTLGPAKLFRHVSSRCRWRHSGQESASILTGRELPDHPASPVACYGIYR